VDSSPTDYCFKLSGYLHLFFHDRILPAIIHRARNDDQISLTSDDPIDNDQPGHEQNLGPSGESSNETSHDAIHEAKALPADEMNSQTTKKASNKKSHCAILLQDHQNDPECHSKKNESNKCIIEEETAKRIILQQSQVQESNDFN